VAATTGDAFYGFVDAALDGKNTVVSSPSKIVTIAGLTTGPNDRSFLMSALNGDKSRFHRERKQKIARRQRTRELLKREAVEAKSVDASARAQRRPVSA
jgi:hypothetical protein